MLTLRTAAAQGYYAFVESIELIPKAFAARGDGAVWRDLVGLRKRRDLPLPTHVAWLDCIAAEYLHNLEWARDTPDYSSADEREVRREQIQAMDRRHFKVVQLLLSNRDKTEAGELELYLSSQWHEVRLAEDGERPVFVGDDYSAVEGGGAIGNLDYLGPADAGAEELLYKVFNVDFIAEMREDEDFYDGGTSQAPLTPGGDDDSSALALNKIIEKEHPAIEDDNEMSLYE